MAENDGGHAGIDMKISPFPVLFAVCLLSFSVSGLAAPQVLVEDTFAVHAGKRKAGSDLRGQEVGTGGVAWKVIGNLAIAEQGGVTASGEDGSVAVVPIPEPTGTVTLEADVNPAGSGFIGLAFMTRGNLNFWGDAALWILLSPSGKCEARTGDDVIFSENHVPAFRKGELNRLELIYDAGTNSVAVKLNGTTVLEKTALGAKPDIHFAAFRFQEKLQPGVPMLSNFKVSESE